MGIETILISFLAFPLLFLFLVHFCDYKDDILHALNKGNLYCSRKHTLIRHVEYGITLYLYLLS